MNALIVQNPCHKCDLGNKDNSVTHKKISVHRQYLTVIIITTIIILRLYYICVCALQLTLPSLRSAVLKSRLKTGMMKSNRWG